MDDVVRIDGQQLGSDYTVPLDGTMREPEPDQIVFQYDGKEVGRLSLKSPMHFEGDADESARLFFDLMIVRYAMHLPQIVPVMACERGA